MSRAARLPALAAALALALPAAAQDLTQDHLEVFDLDEDGALSLVEFRVFASNAFIELDADHDNHLTRDEFGAYADDAAFAAMDADGDGRVSRMEFDAQLLSEFHAADLDGDGLLAAIED